MENLLLMPDAVPGLPVRSPPTPSAIPANQSFLPNTILEGTYRIVQRLAQGGMGEIYLAAHERLPGYFAIKAMQAELAYHPEALVRFRREAEILAGVRHPNVVQVIDFNVSQAGVPYLVLEFVDGPDLASELRGGRTLAPFEVMSIIRQVASALAAAHAVGVVHRDLKPENIVLLRAPGQAPVAKVIDFGISLSGVGPRITADSRVMGTPEYMSPEQAPLAPDVNWPAEEAEAVLCKGMARARADRYPSVLEFTDALEAALARSGALDTAPASGSWPPPPSIPTVAASTPYSTSSSSLRRQPIDLRTPLFDDVREDEDDLVPARSYSPRIMAGLTATIILVAVLFAARNNLSMEQRRTMNTASTTARAEVRRVVTGVGDWVDNTRSRLKM